MAFRDIRKPRQFLTPADIAFLIGVAVLITGLLILNINLARWFEDGEWLYPRWSAARTILIGGSEPYGSTIAAEAQNRAYGREAFLNEYPFALNDPFYIVLLYVPLAFLSLLLPTDFAVIQGIWMLLSQVALISIVLLAIRFAEWDPPRWMYVLLFGFALFGYFQFDALRSASAAIILTLLYLLILVALRNFSDEMAGALLFLVAYHWETGALFFVFVMVFVIGNRRWRVFTGLIMSAVILTVISLLVRPGWLLDFLQAVLYNWNRSIEYTFTGTLSYIFSSLPISVSRWATIGTLVLMLFEAIVAVGAYPRHLAWTASLSLALNSMLGLAIFPVNHVILLPAIILVLATVWERWVKRRVPYSLLVLVLAFLIPYGLYYQTLFTPERLYADLMKVLPPVLMVLGLYWMRWWAIRPPRIWADQFGSRL